MQKTSKQTIITINERTYIVNAFKGLKGWSYLPRLTKYIFPFVGFIFNRDSTDDDVIATLVSLLSGENAKEVEQLIIEMVSDVNVDGSRVDFDTEFTQNYDALLKLVVEVLKLNYQDSFQRLVTASTSE